MKVKYLDKNAETIIEIKNLEFSYEDAEKKKSTVLKGINLSIKKGEFLAILGHNGSGKSTLAKHLNAILVPQNGSVAVEGIDTANENALYDIRQRVGMVFQNPDNQLVATIVEEDVAFAPENLGVPETEIRKRVDYALDAVNMSEFSKHAPHMLSGGQKQRIAIAGVLAMKPDVLVMDEPTAMLDPIGRREIIETVKKLNREENITVVMITHFMEEAAQADRVVVMNRGESVMEGTPKEVFAHVEELKKIGLDVPQTTELLYLLKKSGVEIKQDLLTVDECVEEILGRLEKGEVANG
ncbi:MAG: energy-coupling factor transporter ATPase [Ruminococcaceae bacterium]|nr:energy-coupling factor transporter ATPase [Oscillospiraceae bacterium]